MDIKKFLTWENAAKVGAGLLATHVLIEHDRKTLPPHKFHVGTCVNAEHPDKIQL